MEARQAAVQVPDLQPEIWSWVWSSAGSDHWIHWAIELCFVEMLSATFGQFSQVAGHLEPPHWELLLLAVHLLRRSRGEERGWRAAEHMLSPLPTAGTQQTRWATVLWKL